MNFEEHVNYIKSVGADITLDSNINRRVSTLNDEALFHLPFIAMCTLLLAADKRKPRSSELGGLVRRCISEGVLGRRSDDQQLLWSANLRMRIARAILFLEVAGLVRHEARNDTVCVTDRGRKVIDAAGEGDGNLAVSLALIKRAYRNMAVEKQIGMGLS